MISKESDEVKSDFHQRAEKFARGIDELSDSLDMRITTDNSDSELLLLDCKNQDKIKTENVYEIEDVSESSEENAAQIASYVRCPVCKNLRDNEKMINGMGYDYPMCFNCNKVIAPYDKLKRGGDSEVDGFPECYKSTES